MNHGSEKSFLAKLYLAYIHSCCFKSASLYKHMEPLANEGKKPVLPRLIYLSFSSPKQLVAWKKYCAEYSQKSMERCMARHCMTKIMLKMPLNTIQSVSLSQQKVFADNSKQERQIVARYARPTASC